MSRGCELGDGFSCAHFALDRSTRLEALTRNQRGQALRAAEQGCEAGALLGCVMQYFIEVETGRLDRESLPNRLVNRVFQTLATPRGTIPFFAGQAAREHRIPNTGHLNVFRDGSRSNPRSLAESSITVNDRMSLRLTRYVASTSSLARIRLRITRGTRDDCPLEIRDPQYRWVLHVNRRGSGLSARLPLDLLFHLRKPTTDLTYCGVNLSTRRLRRHVAILRETRKMLFRRVPRETWGPRRPTPNNDMPRRIPR